MKQFAILLSILGVCCCGRLDSQYLPPHQGGNNYQPQPQASFNHQAQSSFNKGPDGPINKAANDVPILRLDNENDGETYNYAVETGDGVQVQEHGDARGDGTNAEGGFSYTAPDGQLIQIQYQAGPNGFQPHGSHIPTPPPVPAEIQKAVEQNLAEEANGQFDDGQYKEEHQGGYGKQEASASASSNQGSRAKYDFQAQKQYIPPSANSGYKY